MDTSNELLDFVKAMADVDRLRIIGVLAQRSADKSGIAGRLNMPLRDVVDHLAFLEQIGVISLNDNLYELNPDRLKTLARTQLREEKPEYVPAPDLNERSRRTMVSCLEPDGTIKRLPSQPAQLKVILDYLVQAFTPGVDYTEKEVNTIIRRFHVDVSGLRRDLVDAGLLDRERDGSRYWRTNYVEQTQRLTAKGAKNNNNLSGLGSSKKDEREQNE